jgi:hypothetical protein
MELVINEYTKHRYRITGEPSNVAITAENTIYRPLFRKFECRDGVV